MSAASRPQPKPVPGRLDVAERVLDDIRERVTFGRKKYGTVLQTHNGRDALWDAYQEQLDQVMYLRQELLERELDLRPDRLVFVGQLNWQYRWPHIWFALTALWAAINGYYLSVQTEG